MITDLLQEVGQRNHVRVAVLRADTKRGRNVVRRLKFDEVFGVTTCAPALALADHLRLLSGRPAIYLGEFYRRLGGQLVSVAPNLRTTVGINFCAANLAGTDGGQVAQADYIALSNNTNAPAAGDSSATTQWATGVATNAAPSGSRGEWTGLGLTRALATMAHTGGATSYTAAKTFTASGTSTGSQLAGLFGGAGRTAQTNGATNILFLESTFTATDLVTSDQLSLTWTVNI